MEGLGKALGGRAGGLSEYALAGRLDAAVRASSAQFDDPDTLARLRVRLAHFGTSATGAPALKGCPTSVSCHNVACHSVTRTRSRACACASPTSAPPRRVRPHVEWLFTLYSDGPDTLGRLRVRLAHLGTSATGAPASAWVYPLHASPQLGLPAVRVSLQPESGIKQRIPSGCTRNMLTRWYPEAVSSQASAVPCSRALGNAMGKARAPVRYVLCSSIPSLGRIQHAVRRGLLSCALCSSSCIFARARLGHGQPALCGGRAAGDGADGGGGGRVPAVIPNP